MPEIPEDARRAFVIYVLMRLTGGILDVADNVTTPEGIDYCRLLRNDPKIQDAWVDGLLMEWDIGI